MELKKKKWECRYVEEYLVVGEAPEQVRNCFQQRSRWCKGHFQIVFGPKNPLLQKELSWPMKIMYCSGEFFRFFSVFFRGREVGRERESRKKKNSPFFSTPLFFFKKNQKLLSQACGPTSSAP